MTTGRRLLAALGRAIDRALTWWAPISSMRLDALTNDTADLEPPEEG